MTVLALFVEITLACLECVFAGAVFGLAFTVPFGSVGLDAGEPFPFGGSGGGALDLREVALLVVVEADEIVDATEDLVEEVDNVRFATGAGDRFLLSTEGEDGGLLPLIDTAETLDAVEETLALGEVAVVPVVLALVVETVETTRDRATELRAAELGVISDLAVSKLVDPSLAVDIVEFGRDRPEGDRSVEGPAAVLRIVDA